MIPSPWVGLILALAAYRLTRLVGWDEFPLAAKVRARVIGERWIPLEPPNVTLTSDDRHGPGTSTMPALPGKQPTSEVEEVRPAYDRPTLAHLVHCPFCLGWWISLSTYLVWLAWDGVLYGLAPLALSGAVGLIAKNLDA